MHIIIDRYITDIPFLCFLTNIYVATRCEELLKSFPGDLPIDNTVFRVRFTTKSFGPVIDVMHVDDADRQLSKRLSAFLPPPSKFDAKNRPILSSDSKRGQPGPQIEVDVFDCIHTSVIRFIPLDPDFRVQGREGVLDSQSPYLNSGQEIRANPVGFVPIHVYDVIDRIFSRFYVPGQDPWTYDFRGDDGQEQGMKHVLDLIDEYARSTSLQTEIK